MGFTDKDLLKAINKKLTEKGNNPIQSTKELDWMNATGGASLYRIGDRESYVIVIRGFDSGLSDLYTDFDEASKDLRLMFGDVY